MNCLQYIFIHKRAAHLYFHQNPMYENIFVSGPFLKFFFFLKGNVISIKKPNPSTYAQPLQASRDKYVCVLPSYVFIGCIQLHTDAIHISIELHEHTVSGCHMLPAICSLLYSPVPPTSPVHGLKRQKSPSTDIDQLGAHHTLQC